MSINPEDIDLVTVDKLDDLTLALDNFFAHANLNGKLGKTTINDFVIFLAPHIASLGSSGYIPVNGHVLANPIPGQVKYSIVGIGTFTWSGGTLETTDEMNIVSSNGISWSLTVGIPIDLTLYLKKSDITSKNHGNLANPSIIETGLISSTGTTPNTVGWKRIFVPIVIDDIIVQGITPNGSKYSGWFTTPNAAGFITRDFAKNNGQILKANIPINAKYLGMTIKMASEASDAVAFPAMMVYYGTLTKPYEAYTGIENITSILGNILEAKVLSSGSEVPDPIDDENAVNKGYLESVSVLKSSLKGTTHNWFNPEWVIKDMLINSTGAKQNVAGWDTFKIDISEWTDETSIIIGNVVTASSTYRAFYNASDVMISFNSINNNGTQQTFTIPVGTKYLYWTVKAPADNVAVYEHAIVTKGNEPISSWTPYNFVINEIDGMPLQGGSGQSYDQSLNTTDDVNFNSVTAGLGNFVAIDFGNVIEWDGVLPAPVGLEIGYGYFNTTGGYLTVRLA